MAPGEWLRLDALPGCLGGVGGSKRGHEDSPRRLTGSRAILGLLSESLVQ